MSLVIKKQAAVFDPTQIGRGSLIWGRHTTWNDGKAGFVTSAEDNRLIVQYFPGIGNITNHFIIPISEVVDGQWEIRWSADLVQIQGYNINTAGNGQQKEGVDEDDTGGTDI